MSHLSERMAKGRALVAYLTASDPDDETFMESALGCAEGGARVLEIGIPHSEPVADGPVIQGAHERALKAAGGAEKTLRLAERIRRAADLPIVLFTYLNPVLAMGLRRFAAEAKSSGADGVLVLDLPPEEEPEWFGSLAESGLDSIVLLTPNTSEERASRLVRLGRGFVYLTSRVGVTGTHDTAHVDLAHRVRRARAASGLPAAVGFGVKSSADAEKLWAMAEGVVVGSSLIERLKECRREAARDTARAFVQGLVTPALENLERESHP